MADKLQWQSALGGMAQELVSVTDAVVRDARYKDDRVMEKADALTIGELRGIFAELDAELERLTVFKNRIDTLKTKLMEATGS